MKPIEYRENKHLEQENEILKQAMSIVTAKLRTSIHFLF